MSDGISDGYKMARRAEEEEAHRLQRTASLPTLPPGPDDWHERIAGGYPVTWQMLNELINEDARKHRLETYWCAPSVFSECGLVLRIDPQFGSETLYYPVLRDVAALTKFARGCHEKRKAEDARERLGEPK